MWDLQHIPHTETAQLVRDTILFKGGPIASDPITVLG